MPGDILPDRETRDRPEIMKKIAGLLQRKRWLRNLLVAGGVLVALGLLAFAFRVQILTGIGSYLIVGDQLHPADILFVLNGDPDSRPFRAAELYQQGLAPRIVIARSENQPIVDLGLVRNETDISIGVMESLGVPAADILTLQMPGGVTSTFDEATLLRQYVEEHDVHSVILVTSAFHTRRARWIFLRELHGLPVTLEMAAAPNHGFDATNWWQSEYGLITVNNEYLKLFYYLWKYR
jgi:uncharacterized SAM-binding protein YcdF (DUF218 family)